MKNIVKSSIALLFVVSALVGYNQLYAQQVPQDDWTKFESHVPDTCNLPGHDCAPDYVGRG